MDTRDQPEPSLSFRIDPKVVAFLSSIGIRLVGRDPKHAGRIIWRREPMIQGEELEYEFSTREGIEFGSYFHMELADEIHDGGFVEGQDMLRSQLAKLLSNHRALT
jgi:hypothetical protein